MRVIEYGKENAKVIILLHGGGLSWWSYRDVAERLQEEYHVILPILDGHAGSDAPFTSIEENAKRVIQYIDENLNGSVTMIGGLSLGAQIAVEILSQRFDICKAAIIESALVIPMKMTHALTKPMMDMSFGLIAKEWFAKLQFQSMRIKPELYEEYYRDTCQITKADMTAFLKANSDYRLKSQLADTKAQVAIVVGAREQFVMIQSAKKLHEMIPDSLFVIKNNLHHGEYSINHGDKYVDDMMRFLQEIL